MVTLLSWVDDDVGTVGLGGWVEPGAGVEPATY
jgi:hypothetical protein